MMNGAKQQDLVDKKLKNFLDVDELSEAERKEKK
jgi:hypothetical protein